MSDSEIVQNLIRQLGQSQRERHAPELDPGFARVDERSPEELLAFARGLAPFVNYYASDDAQTPAGDWTPLFPDTGASLEAYLAERSGRVPPHLALFLAFLDLHGRAQELANGITGRHLDFFYGDVLRLRRRPPVPDRVHVLFEPKKGAAPVLVLPEHLLSAGKDATGVERLYAPVGETVINAAKVESLRSVFLDRTGRGAVRFAPIADSSDGLGGKFAGETKWKAFGHAGLPRAEVGLALSSPVLRMREGTRKASVRLKVSGLGGSALSASALGGAFDLFLTGEKGWIAPASVTASVAAGDVLQWELTLLPDAPPVVDYSAAVHGYAYAAGGPVLQMLLREEGATAGYLDFAGLVLQRASIAVEVSGVASLTLESDAGALDPAKAFLPFGPQPTAGSRFMVSYPEALSKKLSELTLKVQWKDAPTSFSSHYANYGESQTDNDDFTASASFRDAAGTAFSAPSVELFRTGNARLEQELRFTAGGTAGPSVLSRGKMIGALSAAGSGWSLLQAHRLRLAAPILLALKPAPPVREGFVTLTLNRGFLHAEYRKTYVEKVVKYAKGDLASLVILNEPYTPTVQGLSLSYRAYTDDVPISSAAAADFANPDVQFFHLAPFGPMRAHGYQRRQLAFVAGTDVPLLPPFPDEGELLIGLSGLGPGDSVSLLFQVAEGSADPELEREEVLWSVLCDDHWKALDAGELVLDTTNDLLASGIVKIVVPAEATTLNTVLPPGLVWVRAAVARNVDAVSQLVAVAANAVEARFMDRGNDPAHLESALPAGSVAKLKSGLAAIKKVSQPFASFGGSPVETDRAFRTRAAERLRHRERCVTAWDYERIVLGAFPGVHKVKCVPHAREGSWMAPGHVLLVLVPDLRNGNAVDPLQPRVDADTLSRVTAHVRARAGMQVAVKVKNPRYQKVRLDFAVRFHAGYEFNFYRGALEAELVRALSPWAFEADRDISFGGTVYKSVLLNLVEELPYVDYVTEFRMYTFAGEVPDSRDLEAARPETPDTILVSDRTHTIVEAA